MTRFYFFQLSDAFGVVLSDGVIAEATGGEIPPRAALIDNPHPDILRAWESGGKTFEHAPRAIETCAGGKQRRRAVWVCGAFMGKVVVCFVIASVALIGRPVWVDRASAGDAHVALTDIVAENYVLAYNQAWDVKTRYATTDLDDLHGRFAGIYPRGAEDAERIRDRIIDNRCSRDECDRMLKFLHGVSEDFNDEFREYAKVLLRKDAWKSNAHALSLNRPSRWDAVVTTLLTQLGGHPVVSQGIQFLQNAFWSSTPGLVRGVVVALEGGHAVFDQTMACAYMMTAVVYQVASSVKRRSVVDYALLVPLVFLSIQLWELFVALHCLAHRGMGDALTLAQDMQRVEMQLRITFGLRSVYDIVLCAARGQDLTLQKHEFVAVVCNMTGGLTLAHISESILRLVAKMIFKMWKTTSRGAEAEAVEKGRRRGRTKDNIRRGEEESHDETEYLLTRARRGDQGRRRGRTPDPTRRRQPPPIHT